MKKYSRGSKRTMKRTMRSKKMSRRRRQRGGGEIVINCTIDDNNKITATSTNPSIGVVVPGNSLNTLTITSTTPIKNIRCAGRRAPLRLTSLIKYKDLAGNKTVIPASSGDYARAVTTNPTYKKLNSSVGMPFPSGIEVSGLSVASMGLTSVDRIGAVYSFTVTVTT